MWEGRKEVRFDRGSGKLDRKRGRLVKKGGGGGRERREIVFRIYHLRVLKRHLPRGHAGVLAEVHPRRVDDCHIVLFVACLSYQPDCLFLVTSILEISERAKPP